jgi:segregation and condensation protein B
METNQVKQIIEALLFITDTPLSVESVSDILGETGVGHNVEQLLQELGKEYDGRQSPMELRFVAGGYQFATRKEFAPWIHRLYKEKTTLRLSTSAMETLSIIAYKQPITRSEIEEIRGVEVTGVLETLLERKLTRIVGRKETIGRPLLYGTTTEFLRHFGLGHLSELPSIEEISSGEEAPAEQEAEITAEENE